MEAAIQREILRCETAARSLLDNIQTEKKGKYFSFTSASAANSPLAHVKFEQARALDIARTLQYCTSNVMQLVKGNQLDTKVVQEHFMKKPWTQGALSTVAVLLSDVFEVLRALKNKADSGTSSTVWVAPDSFDRSTSKYWVEESKLSELMLTCVGEAPLLVYGKSGQLSSQIPTSAGMDNHDHLWEKLSTKVSSIYFDSVNLDLYRERLARREGAQLFRVRWYGTCLPRGNKPVFLELKTHHESWVQAKSVKERATIVEADMKAFLDLSKTLNAVEAQSMLLRANPDLKGEKCEKATALLLRMRALVDKHRLRPCVRTSYDRVAFQSSDSNALRLTLDRQVTVTDERSAPHGSWCIDYGSTSIQPTASNVVPFAVFEIKLGEGQSSSAMDALIQNHVILDAAKFSKFLTGAATFNHDKVDTLPYWASHPAFFEFFHTPNNISSGPKADEDMAKKEGYPGIKGGSGESKNRVGLFFRNNGNSSETGSGESRNRFGLFFRNSGNGNSKWIAPKKAVRVEPKTYFANERTFIQWISAGILLLTTSALLLEFESGRGYTREASKGLLALTMAVVTYALFLYYQRLYFIQHSRPYGYTAHFGPTVLTGACLIGSVVLLKDLLAYESESSNTIQSNQPLALADNALVSRMYEEKDHCLLHDIRPFSLLNIEASDIIYDTEQERLLVASMTEILSFPAPIWTAQEGLHVPADSAKPFIAGQVPGADFEALAIFEGDLYAVSEVEMSTQVSEMMKFEWTSSTKLSRTRLWTVTPAQSEGIAIVAERELLISGSGGVKVYGVGTLSESSSDGAMLSISRSLNSKILKAGMEEGKTGAMRFFEGLLYILHDNHRVIRVWNVSSGIMEAEWPLPMPPQGSGKQWEGFELQRVTKQSPSSSSSLRGGSSSADDEPEQVLLLHLAQDTPSSIWTLVVQEGEAPGSILYPACSGVVN